METVVTKGSLESGLDARRRRLGNHDGVQHAMHALREFLRDRVARAS